MLRAAEDVLRRAAGRPGHIFNLGHGILPSTPVENVQMLAQYVHRASRR
jgi:uroporphyrinogen decarboxylase